MQKLYKWVLKPILFKFDAEYVHDSFIKIGHSLGSNILTKRLINFIFNYENTFLKQKISDIYFKNPVGLAAGFDYESSLIQILPQVGFGFETIGTITNNPYEGNQKPRLGRLLKSQSLMVNKGFKNPGIKEILKKIIGIKFEIPVGLSIGATNTTTILNQQDAINDIVEAFKIAENSKVLFSYYELNISCPNLQTPVEFYSPNNLNELLNKVTENKLSKPLFIKMPIDKTNNTVLEMLKVIIKYPITGVIIGNLQKNKKDSSLNPAEVTRFTKGNFSGKPTEKRSNELISLAYKAYGKKLIIIGCGGVFCAEDAYKKIKAGATLIQLITGMIFEGPQAISDINLGLVKLIKRDGFKNISEAVGTNSSPKKDLGEN